VSCGLPETLGAHRVLLVGLSVPDGERLEAAQQAVLRVGRQLAPRQDVGFDTRGAVQVPPAFI
jgi:hypothetical protein